MSILQLRRYLSRTQAAAQYQPLIGVTNGSNAPAGQIGEFLSAQQSTGLPMTTSTPMNITSLSLPPGDWDVDGTANIQSSASVGSLVVGAISTVSATLPTPGGISGRAQLNIVGMAVAMLSTGRVRISVAATTTVYLCGQMTFASGTGSASGTIQARRMR